MKASEARELSEKSQLSKEYHLESVYHEIRKMAGMGLRSCFLFDLPTDIIGKLIDDDGYSITTLYFNYGDVLGQKISW